MLCARSNGPERVVLVKARDTEHHHDGIADELLHRAPVTLDDRRHRLEVAGQQPSQRLRVESFTERGRTDQIAEDQGHDLVSRRRQHLMFVCGPMAA